MGSAPCGLPFDVCNVSDQSMPTHTSAPNRLTAHRRAVLDTIAALPGHPDAGEVYDAVRRRRPRIAIGTVYAALHHLAAAGLIAPLRRPDGVVAYDRETRPHDHVVCRLCGRLDDVPPAPVHERARGDYAAVTAQTGYAVERHRSEFSGVCPACHTAEDADDTRTGA